MVNNTKSRKLSALAGFLIFFAPLLACAPGSRINIGEDHRIFPPEQLLPLKIAISTPLNPVSFIIGHESLTPWSDSPGQRRILMNCTWNDGLTNFVKTMIPGTEVIYLGSARNPLSAVGSGVEASTDTLGNVLFQVENTSALDVARHRGWTHLVVPDSLNYLFTDDGDELVLYSNVAILDAQEQQIVWQGLVDSREISANKLGPDDSKQPALTKYEATTYRFILNLVETMNRQLNDRPDSRHQLASPCQDKPPLLQDMN